MTSPAPDTTDELIKRIESATGKDSRILADDVLLSCGWHTTDVGDGLDRYAVWKSPDGEDSYWDGDQPNPVESLDAVLSLARDYVEFNFMLKAEAHLMSRTHDRSLWPSIQAALLVWARGRN